MSRERGGSPSLTPHMAAMIKGMIRRGDSHALIARFFGINMGRVADIKFQRRFAYVMPMDQEELPWRLPVKTPYEEWMEAYVSVNAIMKPIVKRAKAAQKKATPKKVTRRVTTC